MKILITGSTGLLGQALTGHLARSCDVTGLSRHAPETGGGGRHVVCDLLDGRRAVEVIRSLGPDVVLHTQAMSDVDACARDPASAHAHNVQATTHLTQALAGSRALLVYLSTDYVFDGMKGSPYEEGDIPRPISIYGATKLEGEQVALRYPQAVVVRPSTLFGAGRMNFCDFIVSRVRGGQTAEAFCDQVTSPTYSEDLAVALGQLSAALLRLRDRWPSRIYHMTNDGGCSRVAFARQVADLLGCSRDLVLGIPMAQQGRPAARPANSSLVTTQLHHVIGRTLRPWQDALHAYLRQSREIYRESGG